MRYKRVTLTDVAKEAGVALSTASLAINDRPRIAHETKAKVIEAAKALGYICPKLLKSEKDMEKFFYDPDAKEPKDRSEPRGAQKRQRRRKYYN